MIEIKNIVKTLSPERNPSTRLKTDNLRLFEFGNVRIIICWLLVEKQITDELLKSASKYARLDNKKRPWERSFFVGA